MPLSDAVSASQSAASERFFLAAASVTPIPILTIRGPIGLCHDGFKIGDKDVSREIARAVGSNPTQETPGGDQRPYGVYELVLSVVPS